MKSVRSLTTMAAVAAALSIAAPARADMIDFYLTQAECTGGCGAGTAPAPIAASNTDAVEVIVTTTEGSAGDYTQAQVEFLGVNDGAENIDTPAYINVNIGGNTANLNATVSIAGGVTISYPGQAEDHFGDMDVWTGAVEAGTVTFTLDAENGWSWTNAANVLTPTTGYGAAYSHGFEATTAAQYAGYDVPASVPEPASLTLFGAALAGLGAFRRRRRFT